MNILKKAVDKIKWFLFPDKTDEFTLYFSYHSHHVCGTLHFTRLPSLSDNRISVKINSDNHKDIDGLIVRSRNDFENICKQFDLYYEICDICGKPMFYYYEIEDVLHLNNDKKIHICCIDELKSFMDSYFGFWCWRPTKVISDIDISSRNSLEYEYLDHDNTWKKIPINYY